MNLSLPGIIVVFSQNNEAVSQSLADMRPVR